MRFRIDPDLYTGATHAREREWRMALGDLNAEVDGEEPTLTLFRREDDGVDIEVTGLDGQEAPVRAELTRELTRRPFRDYRRVIEQLAGAGHYGGRHLETLDYAKKLVHDEAGEMVQEALRPFVTLEHRLARRVFTLVFLVSSALPESLVTRHRHGP